MGMKRRRKKLSDVEMPDVKRSVSDPGVGLGAELRESKRRLKLGRSPGGQATTYVSPERQGEPLRILGRRDTSSSSWALIIAIGLIAVAWVGAMVVSAIF